MTSSVNLRVAAAVAAGFLPPALALVIIMATGMFSPIWTAVAIIVGVVAGGISASMIANSITARAERIEALAAALQAHRPPPHVIPDEGDTIARAERKLLQSADTVIAEIGALTEQRDELDAILRNMTEAVVVTGARGEVILLNGQARNTFALSPDANYQGRDFVELCRDPRLQEFVASSTASPDGKITAAEVHIQHPSPRYLAVSGAPVKRQSGSRMWLFVFHDITQLKTYETMRADFVANLSHEIRTPLSALYGYAETLERGVDDPETAKRFLGIIERQAKRLARLIDDLVSLSNLERGLAPLNLEEVAPRSILEDAAELMRERAERGGIQLELGDSHEVPAMHVDRDKMHQVMLNLIDNAIKYTPRGGRVTLQVRPASDWAGNGAHGVEMVVSDTGEGIPAADIPRLTERFYRVDRARSRELGGTGLGLAIVKHIVQLHHGTLKIESRVGEGTTVKVSLPVAAG